MWVFQRKQHLGFHWEKDAVRHPALGSEVSAASSSGWSVYGSICVQQVINNSFVTKASSCPLESISSRMEQGPTLQSDTADSSGKKDPLLSVKCCSSTSPKQSRKAHAVTEKPEIKGKNYAFSVFLYFSYIAYRNPKYTSFIKTCTGFVWLLPSHQYQ